MSSAPHAYPTLAEATRVWARVAALSFGGPAGQIAVMHRIVVEEKRWIGDDRFLHALNFCMLLPGPEAQQLATYIGWLMHGVRGALIAGILFILPGVVAIMALSWVYAIWGDMGIVAGLFFGLKAAVLAIVLQALFRIGKRALKNDAMRVIALLSFVAIFAFGAPFPVIVGVAALVGWIGAKAGLAAFAPGGGHGAVGGAHVNDADTLLGAEMAQMPPAERRGALLAGLVALVLWLVPVALLLVAVGPGNVFTDIATFFSKMAVVTFGGAYAVLAYVAQEAAGRYGWLAPGEMLDGLGLAETTPGPLIMVTQFVGFLAAWRETGASVTAGIAGGLLTTWVTFAPCFAFIFLGAPYIERLRRNASLAAALAGITAAVVGVILNLALWFGWHFIVPGGTLDLWAAGLSALALALVFGLRLGVVQVIAICAAAGIVLRVAGLA